jgi:hypothetical protein
VTNGGLKVDLLARITNCLAGMAPHVRVRATARLLAEARDEIARLTSGEGRSTATTYSLTMGMGGLQLVAVRCEDRTYVVRWTKSMQGEIEQVGDGRGFDDLGIPPPPEPGIWLWQGTFHVDGDDVVYVGAWYRGNEGMLR